VQVEVSEDAALKVRRQADRVHIKGSYGQSFVLVQCLSSCEDCRQASGTKQFLSTWVSLNPLISREEVEKIAGIALSDPVEDKTLP
jgi:hypothetical protein